MMTEGQSALMEAMKAIHERQTQLRETAAGIREQDSAVAARIDERAHNLNDAIEILGRLCRTLWKR